MKWWKSLFPLLSSCWFCDTPVRKMVWDSVADGLCQNCDQQIEQIEGLIYVICGRMWQSLDVSLCQDCSRLTEADRLRERGFNQAELLARQGNAQPEHTKPARSLSFLIRSFSAGKRVDRRHTVLLVDDIYTTGTTVRERQGVA